MNDTRRHRPIASVANRPGPRGGLRLSRRGLVQSAPVAAAALAFGGRPLTGRSFLTPAALSAEGTPKQGGTLVVSVGAQIFPESFDPSTVGGDSFSFLLQLQVYDYLLRWSPDGTSLEAGLAETWDAFEDGRTYTFRLREAAFQDDSPVTADDVVSSLGRWFAQEAEFSGTASAADERTVAIALATPWVNLPFDLAGPRAAILPRRLVEEQKLIFFEQPVGSGPFALSRWDPGKEVVLTRNPTYWDAGKPYLDEVRFVLEPDPAVRLQQFREGDADLFLGVAPSLVSPSEARTLSADPEIVIVEDEPLFIYAVLINASRPPFDDLKLRQAMNHAIDREAIAAEVFFGDATPATTYIPAGVPWHDPTVPGYAFDLERARALVAESAGKDGFAGEFLVLQGDPTWSELSRVVADHLAAIGGDISIVEVTGDEAFGRFGANRWDLLVNWLPWGGSPYGVSRANASSRGNAGFSGYPLDELDAVLQAAATELEPGEQTRLYQTLQAELNETGLWIFLVQTSLLYPHRAPVQGLTVLPFGMIPLWNVWRDDASTG